MSEIRRSCLEVIKGIPPRRSSYSSIYRETKAPYANMYGQVKTHQGSKCLKICRARIKDYEFEI